jgi:hypothetical protein
MRSIRIHFVIYPSREVNILFKSQHKSTNKIGSTLCWEVRSIKELNRIFGRIKLNETFTLSLSISPISFLPFTVSGICCKSMSFALTIFRFA